MTYNIFMSKEWEDQTNHRRYAVSHINHTILRTGCYLAAMRFIILNIEIIGKRFEDDRYIKDNIVIQNVQARTGQRYVTLS